MPLAKIFRRFGTSSARSSNRSFGAPQSRPMIATLGPCCMLRPLGCRERCVGAAAELARRRADARGCLRGARILPTGRNPGPPRAAGDGEDVREASATAAEGAGGAVARLERGVGLSPRWVLEDLFGQPVLADYVWVRAAAVMGVVLALLMVLVAQRIDELWWWSWAFAVLEVGTATVFVLNAMFGVPGGARHVALLGARDGERPVRRRTAGRHGHRGPGEAVRLIALPRRADARHDEAASARRASASRSAASAVVMPSSSAVSNSPASVSPMPASRAIIAASSQPSVS